MVYTNRTEKCNSSTEETVTTKSEKHFKDQKNGNYSDSNKSSQSTSAIGANNAWSKNAAESDKWKFNNMIKNNRDAFNSLHFN
ncbi:uncharacterized protein LOC119634148 [Glossina fuscipes]|uniref:Uncharacterized protein LOC119634148 n=1 Tax=Glossina fuscipes TaxID=7396 RepID=A0A8U0WG12_9MUSC|nr:uncharacterized protein LOC119634148 [Glossina fuscipes]